MKGTVETDLLKKTSEVLHLDATRTREQLRIQDPWRVECDTSLMDAFLILESLGPQTPRDS